MKLSAPILLSCCLLLMVTGSCKKEAVDEPTPNLANCRIVKEIYKSNRGRYKDQPETITVEGKQVVIYPQLIADFSYDDKGRIVRKENETEPGKEVYWTTYTYTPTSIIRVDRVNADPNDDTKGLTNLQTIIPLNERGLDARRRYDAEGFNIDTLDGNGRVMLVRENGNLVRSVSYWPDMTVYTTASFDTTHLNVPNRYPFLGKTDRNLIIQYIVSSPNPTYYKKGELFRVNYYYEFDRYGRVKRVIRAFHNDYGSCWPYMPDGAETSVYDYEYECS